MTEDTQFEQKLAAYRPRLLREITQISAHGRPCGYRYTFERKVRPHITACACCFVLGAATMFFIMTCCFDRTPVRTKPVVASRSPQTYTVPLRMQDLDGVTSPADLMVRIRRQPVIRVADGERRMKSEELGVRSYLYSGSIAHF
jgi:hypothetical protein